jgi:hypothetical protein
MEFTIQYFGEFDRLLYVEGVDAFEMNEALGRARETLKQPTVRAGLPAVAGI